MKKPGLDGRHRDKDGKISKKHGNTRNENLTRPIAHFRADATLKTMRKTTGEVSESNVRERAAKKRP